MGKHFDNRILKCNICISQLPVFRWEKLIIIMPASIYVCQMLQTSTSVYPAHVFMVRVMMVWMATPVCVMMVILEQIVKQVIILLFCVKLYCGQKLYFFLKFKLVCVNMHVSTESSLHCDAFRTIPQVAWLYAQPESNVCSYLMLNTSRQRSWFIDLYSYVTLEMLYAYCWLQKDAKPFSILFSRFLICVTIIWI